MAITTKRITRTAAGNHSDLDERCHQRRSEFQNGKKANSSWSIAATAYQTARYRNEGLEQSFTLALSVDIGIYHP